MLYNILFWGIPTTALVTYLLMIFFFAINHKDKTTRTFMFVLYNFAIWVAASLLMKMNVYPGVVFWNRVMISCIFLSPFLVYLFISVFTNTVKISKNILFAILSIVLIVFSAKGFVVSDATTIEKTVKVGERIITQVEFIYKLGSLATICYILMFFTIIIIVKKVHNCVFFNQVEFRKIKPITIGVILIYIGVLFNIFPLIGKYPVDILMCFINGILMIYAIYRNRMFEIKFIITKGLVFSFLTAILMSLYFILAYLLNKHLILPFIPNQYVTFAIALLMALLFLPLMKFAKSISEMLFYKSEYSQRNALKDFSISISNNLSITDIANEVIETISKAMNSKHVCLLSKDISTGNYITFKSLQILSPMDFVLHCDSPIISYLKNKNECLTLDNIESTPHFKSLWDSELQSIKLMDAQVFVPLISRNDLIGIILLTSKANNIDYTLDDLDLLKSFAASTAMAMNNAMLYSKAREDADTDDLTGLFNRRYLYRYLDEHITQGTSSTVSLIVLDLDFFKLYNELYGFVEGDKAIAKTATIISQYIQRRGIAARYSGEQFMIVLPEHDTSSAFKVAEMIRQKIETNFLDDHNTTKQFLTISAGVITYPICASNVDELIKRGNMALNNAKEKGKNSTDVYTTLKKYPSEKPANSYSENKLRTTVYALTAAIDAKDHYTFSHSQNVAKYATALAKELGLDEMHQKIISEAGLLHDIGKIGVPENILTKQGRLNDDEYDAIKKHVDISINIVKHLSSMEHVIPAIVSHHERWDGYGYPRGLKATEIPIEGRCLIIADAFDAITSKRSYKEPVPIENALQEIERNAGKQFDSELARIFVKMIRDGKLTPTPTLNI